MWGGALAEMKEAASAYVKRQNLQTTRIAVVSFGSQSRIHTSLSRDVDTLKTALQGLDVDGSTRMDLGLAAAFSLLSASSQTPASVSRGSTTSATNVERRSILLFTDGYPDSFSDEGDPATRALSTANSARSSGARMVAIGTGDADREFLAQLTGDPALVFGADDGAFGEAFEQAEQALNAPTGRALIQSEKVENYDAGREWGRVAVWAALIGLGVTSALLIAQSVYARRRAGAREFLGALGGAVAGALAGTLGQWMFASVGDEPMTLALGRLVAWAAGGALLGVGMAPFVPNLKPLRALGGGALGGWLGALGFIALARTTSGAWGNAWGDAAGRLLGALLLGFALGTMVVLAEVAFRRAWLRVSYGPRDTFDVSLGDQPVLVGSDRARCRVFAREAAPVAAHYEMENGQPILVDARGGRRALQPGDTRCFGSAEITLCADTMPVDVSPAPPVPIRVASPLANQAAESAIATSRWKLEGAFPIELTPGTLSVGRVEGNAIVLIDAGVSSRHAQFQVGPGTLAVCDLGSTNGTFLNDRRLAPQLPTPLQSGDRVRFGRLEFEVHQN